MRMHRIPCLSFLLPAVLCLAAGCGDDSEADLVLSDLTDAELMFVRRVVVLERARAVALQDRPVGNALLDSLALSWGDSSLSETRAAMPEDPQRAARVGRLLTAMLAAEQDSFVTAARPDRLSAPLPVPVEDDPEAAADGN